jgi:hypothetical protein
MKKLFLTKSYLSKNKTETNVNGKLWLEFLSWKTMFPTDVQTHIKRWIFFSSNQNFHILWLIILKEMYYLQMLFEIFLIHEEEWNLIFRK